MPPHERTRPSFLGGKIGPAIPQTGDRTKDIMMALIRLLRAEGNEERAQELEEHGRMVSLALSMMRR